MHGKDPRTPKNNDILQFCRLVIRRYIYSILLTIGTCRFGRRNFCFAANCQNLVQNLDFKSIKPKPHVNTDM